jgi:hypothetical protein
LVLGFLAKSIFLFLNGAKPQTPRRSAASHLFGFIPIAPQEPNYDGYIPFLCV